MNVKKNRIVLFFVLFWVASFFCASAKSINQHYIIKTKYFDIIYRFPSKDTAKLISKNIDKLYLELRESFEVQDFFHFKNFPVYIEYSTDELNAFYTTYPYRHIVLYDTVPAENLAVYENTILSVLQHELSHAISLNIKSQEAEKLSEFFFDGISFSFYNAPQFITEGIAVQKESEDGFGRLNNSYSLHLIRQAKLEGKFLNYNQITGARDIYPSGNLPYMFGGAFFDFLEKKYGKEKIKLFFLDINSELTNYTTIYKNIFEQEIEKDYIEFFETIDIPKINENPYAEDGVFDYYSLVENLGKKGKQKKDSRPNVISSFLTEEKAGTAWFNQDSNEVIYSEKVTKNSSFSPGVPKKLFSMTGVNKISFSSDGRYLAISRTLTYKTRKNFVTVYDMQEKCFLPLDFGFRDATVLFYNGTYYLVAVRTLSQKSFLEIFQFEEDKKFNLVKQIPFESNVVPFSVTDCGNSIIAFILKSKMDYYIYLYNKELDELNYVAVPREISIRDLSSVISRNFVTNQSGMLLTFSFGKKNNFPRLGFLSLKLENNKFVQPKFHLMTQDISGGVYSPSIYFCSTSRKLPSVVFISKFFDNSKISVLDADKFEFEQVQTEIKNVLKEKNNLDVQDVLVAENSSSEKITVLSSDNSLAEKTFLYNENSSKTENLFPENEDKKFYQIQYFGRGIFLPFSIVPLYDLNFNINSIGFIGATWHTKGFHFSLGFDPFSLNYGVSAILFNMSESGNSLFNLKTHFAFNNLKFLQTEDELVMQTRIPCFTHSNFNLSSTTQFFYGYSVKPVFEFQRFITPKIEQEFYEKASSTLLNREIFEFSTIHKTGANTFERGGVSLGLMFTYSFFNSPYINANGINLGLTTGFAIPSLLSFENPENITCNLPFSFNASIFPSVISFLELDANLVLFSVEVQQGTRKFFLPLYLNRFFITAFYNSSWYYSKSMNMAVINPVELQKSLLNSVYCDSMGIGFNFALTINTGNFVQLGTMNLSAQVLFDINGYNQQNSRIHLKICNQLVF